MTRSLTAVAVSAAPAAAATWNHTSAYMNDQDPGACVARTIALNGTYRWQVFGFHWAHPGKPAKTRPSVFGATAPGRTGRYRFGSTIQNVRARR